MTEERDETGELLPDDQRLTPFGRFLRHTSLDELPELFNVRKGEMSLVGPRPLLMRYLDRYSPEEMRRHEIRPGITGWTQVNGRNALSWEEKFALDLWYVQRQSLALDLKILLMTIWKALKREGITRPGWATTEEFWGNPWPARRPAPRRSRLQRRRRSMTDTNHDEVILNHYRQQAETHRLAPASTMAGETTRTLETEAIMACLTHAVAGTGTGQSLLEMGCENGYLLQMVSERFPELRLTGADYSLDMVELAATRQVPRSEARHEVVRELTFPSESFDAP